MLHRFLSGLCLVALLPFWTDAFSADAPMRIVVSVPGPRNLSYLPIDLISKIGADRAEGTEIQLLHTGGGAVALQNLSNRNCDFAVAGVPAAMSQHVSGNRVAVIAAVDDAPLFILMVRSELRNKVKRIADLKGRVVGVNTSSLTSKTTSQQLAELILRSDGVSPDEVRIVPAGQSWVEQSSLLISGAADATMGDEPFATRLLEEKRVFFLADLTDPAVIRRIPGANFLHAAVETRPELLANEPAKAEKMVKMLRRTLQWMAGHTPQEIVEKLGVQDPAEKDSLIKTLRKYKNIYSRDGRFSTRQIHETDIFFHKTSEGDPVAQRLTLESMIVDRWAGRKE